jgi:hypothetical protein
MGGAVVDGVPNSGWLGDCSWGVSSRRGMPAAGACLYLLYRLGNDWQHAAFSADSTEPA